MATTYGFLPAPAAPKLYTSVIPEADFQRSAELKAKIKSETDEFRNRRYQIYGTPEEQAARERGRQAGEAANYLSSLPIADKYTLANTGGVDPWKTARSTWTGITSEAQKNYVESVNKKRDVAAATAATAAAPVASSSSKQINRLLNPITGAHVYIENADEAAAAQRAGWRGEGEAFKLFGQEDKSPDAVDVVRLRRGDFNDYLLTSDPGEIESAQKGGYVREGVLGRALKTPGATGSKHVQRYMNVISGQHVYSADAKEQEALAGNKEFTREASGDFYAPDGSATTATTSTPASTEPKDEFKLPSTASQDYLDALAKKQAADKAAVDKTAATTV
jgi:hypothetical protein